MGGLVIFYYIYLDIDFNRKGDRIPIVFTRFNTSD